MTTERVKKIEAGVGLFLVLANCLRISFWQHTGPLWLRVAGDAIAIVGFALYLHGQFSKTTTNDRLG
jgi:hypothetical protein